VTETNYGARIRSLRRMLRAATWLLVVLAVGLIVSVVMRPHTTTLITIARVAGALVIVALLLALRIAFRHLPEAQRMAAKFDGEAAADRSGKSV
jgi:protein-S-isoprenylcysteine O-methyltransferase Ste14